MVLCGEQVGNIVKLLSFLRENRECNSGAKFIHIGFATHCQATPGKEGPNEDPDNERDICIPLHIKLEWLFICVI